MKNATLTGPRLLNQKTDGSLAAPRDVLAHMAAVQAQDYYGALWSIGLRCGLTEKQVIEAVEKHEIIRTWPHRGTLHYVLPEDALWMVNLSGPKLIQAARLRHQNLELDSMTLGRSKELLAEALRGKCLARPALLDLLENAGISTKGGRGYHMLWYAAQTGLIYLGPMEGKQQTFGLLADLPVPARELEREAAIAELARRYFTSHGPATIQDFVWWAGLTVAETKAGLAAAKSDLTSEKVDGKEYWFSANATSNASIPDTLLLPGFDEYILGYKDRAAQISTEHFKLVVPGGNGMFMSSVVRNGRVVGLWKRMLKKDKVILAVTPFGSFTKKDIMAIEKQARRYAAFLQLKPEVICEEAAHAALV